MAAWERERGRDGEGYTERKKQQKDRGMKKSANDLTVLCMCVWAIETSQKHFDPTKIVLKFQSVSGQFACWIIRSLFCVNGITSNVLHDNTATKSSVWSAYRFVFLFGIWLVAFINGLKWSSFVRNDTLHGSHAEMPWMKYDKLFFYFLATEQMQIDFFC